MGIFLFFLSLLVAVPSWADVECLLNKRKSFAIRGQRDNRERRAVGVGEILPFLGENKAGTIYKTEIDEKTYFVAKKFFVKVRKETCVPIVEPKVGVSAGSSEATSEVSELDQPTQIDKVEKPDSEQSWAWGFEGGYSLSLSAEPFSNILTPAPDPTVDVNDDSFDSPFVDEVKKGSGFSLRGFIEYRWNDWFGTKFFLGYTQREFEYVFRQNPHNPSQSFVTYDQLSQSTDSFSYQAVQLGMMPKARWDLGPVALDFGIGFFMNYYFETHKVEFRTAPIKLTPYYASTGYNQFDFEVAPRLEVHIDAIYIFGQFNNRLSPSDFSMSPEVGLGYTF